ncbi:hypothetical protein Tco_0150546 [Tanacetum coccineum]
MIRAVELESENSRLLGKIKYDDHDTMIKEFSKLEVAYFNLQLKHQHFNENIENLKSKSSKDVPEFDAFFELGMRDDQIQSHKNTICKFKARISELKANKSDDNLHLDYMSLNSQNSHLKETVKALQNQLENFKAENSKIKLHYQELFDSIKVTHVKTTAKANSLQTKIENLKTQLKGKMSCITSDDKTPKVSAFENLRDTLDTLCEIVEEARNELPSDMVNKRDKFIATTPVTKKKRVTFADPLETSGNNTPKHVKQQSVQPTNTPNVPSIGVSITTTARRSQSKSHTSHDKTLPAKSVPKKKVEDHPQNNMSKLSKKDRVDSCTSVRRLLHLLVISSKGDRKAIRTHMRILSVVRIEVFSLYGYDYIKKIVLLRADLKEYTITERDFKYLYPSEFKDLYLLNLQGHLNHLPPKDKKILTTAVNLRT